MAWCYPATFDLKESFRVCVVSPLSPKEGSRDPLILYAHRVFSPLCPCLTITSTAAMTVILRCLQETNTGCLPYYFHFRGQRGG